MSASRRKGTAWETAVVRWLNDHGFPHAERRALHGNHDLGDITGIPGIVIEAKSVARLDLSGWVDQAETERRNAAADVGAVVHKRRGHGDPGHAYATLPLRDLAWLLRAAGYGTPLDNERGVG